MEKTIQIGKQEIKLKSSAALPRLYRLLLNRDIFADVEKMERTLLAVTVAERDGSKTPPSIEDQYEATTIVENLAFAMNKLCDATQPENVSAWLDRFADPSAIINSDVIIALMEMWHNEILTTATAVKKKEELTGE